jgi:DNA-binding SARP family transcriptional activator
MEIRLFGGFEVRGEADGGTRFESQKVRALLAYLAAQEGRIFSRDQIGELLWTEADGETARRNLRQALYNLRQALPEIEGRLRVDHQTVALVARPEDAIDVTEFLAAHRRGLAGGDDVAVPPLRRAVELYRGELLAGFHVREAAAFEEWLVRQQERLREAARQALAALVRHFAARGEYEEALGHGRRLTEIDPLSEEAHRELMRLYVLAGRRRRALAQYDELAELLARELGAEPLPETRALHRSVLAEELPPGQAPAASPAAPLGPFVPLAGRDEELAALDRGWRAATSGGGRLALVEGPPGIGKTRLVKSFLDRLTSRQQARVVQARCFADGPSGTALPSPDLLLALAALDADDEPSAEGASLRSPRCGAEAFGELAAAVVARLEKHPRLPLVVFVDDLHWGDDGAWDALADLLARCEALPLWLIATADEDARPAGAARRRLVEHPRVDRLAPRRLAARALRDVAVAVAGGDPDAARLADHLGAVSDGLPLAVVEHLDALCDEGVLVAAGERRWSLEGDPAASPSAGLPLPAVIERRIERLPASTRRLLVLAAVIGPTFDVELLERAAHEHMGVVEIALELLLERRLVRQVARRWSDSPRERDLVLWAQGARRGEFELSHALVREAVLAEVPAERRQQLHREVAEALATRAERGLEAPPEVLAHHRAAAGEPAADQKKKRTPR